MHARTEWTALCACLALAAGCSKGVDKKLAPAQANRIELSTFTSAGPGAEPEKFGGSFTATTAVVTWLDGKLFLVLSTGTEGCKVFEPNTGSVKDAVRATISLEPLRDEYKSGGATLEGRSVSVSDAVILARGFNSVLMLAGQKRRELTFESGKIEPGATVVGSVDLDDRDQARKEHSVIKGRFKAVVCDKK